MGYLTFKIRTPGGQYLFESDLTLHELIPLVRQITRQLETRPHLTKQLRGYRAVITPQYDELMLAKEYIKPAAQPAPMPSSPAPGTAEISITVADLSPDVLEDFELEIQAFYNPGSSVLCTRCPERDRCPGSGRALRDELDGWIELDPAAPRTNEPITGLTVRIESQHGERLYERTFSSYILQPFVDQLSAYLVVTGRLKRPEGSPNVGDLIARYDGQPRIDPLLTGLRRAAPSSAAGPASAPIRPSPMVDWDALDADEQDDDAGEQNDDLEITLIATEHVDLARKPMPTERCEAVDSPTTEELQIFVGREVIERLRANVREADHEFGGVLVGQAYLPPTGDQPYVEILGIIPSIDEEGKPTPLMLGYERWRQVQARLAEQFSGQQMVGWYQAHMLGARRVLVVTQEQIYEVSDRLRLTRNETFTHQSFFREPWHVALVIDAVGDRFCFYRWQDGTISQCPGYFIID